MITVIDPECAVHAEAHQFAGGTIPHQIALLLCRHISTKRMIRRDARGVCTVTVSGIMNDVRNLGLSSLFSDAKQRFLP